MYYIYSYRVFGIVVILLNFILGIGAQNFTLKINLETHLERTKHILVKCQVQLNQKFILFEKKNEAIISVQSITNIYGSGFPSI